MDPAQGVVRDTELTRIVRNDHRVAEQAVMADGAPDRRLRNRTKKLSVEDIDVLAGQMLEERDLIGENCRGIGLEPGHDRVLDALRLQPVHRLVIENIVLMTRPQDGQEIKPRLRQAGAKGRKALAANLGGEGIAPIVPRTGIVDRDERRRDQPSMQNRTVFLDELLKVGGEQPNDLPLRDLDADAVEDRGQARRRDLPLGMQRQAGAGRFRPSRWRPLLAKAR